jgi:hypothetical protein
MHTTLALADLLLDISHSCQPLTFLRILANHRMIIQKPKVAYSVNANLSHTRAASFAPATSTHLVWFLRLRLCTVTVCIGRVRFGAVCIRRFACNASTFAAFCKKVEPNPQTLGRRDTLSTGWLFFAGCRRWRVSSIIVHVLEETLGLSSYFLLHELHRWISMDAGPSAPGHVQARWKRCSLQPDVMQRAPRSTAAEWKQVHNMFNAAITKSPARPFVPSLSLPSPSPAYPCHHSRWGLF